MKKTLLLLSSLLMVAALSCTPDSGSNTDDPDKEKTGNTPVVSISADASFNAEMKAKITLTLSEASSSDVKVKLAKAAIQEGKAELAADYNKTVTIKAGDLKAEIEATADVLGLEGGDYQHAIKIDSAEGATVADNAVVYINYTFVFKPDVNVYADAQFASTCEAKLQIALSKATTKDVVVKLETDSQSEAEVEYEQTVTIPAGETQKEIIVKVKVADGLEPGVYPVIIKIQSIENGQPGSASSATINLAYPFSKDIILDGLFDDWDDASLTTFTLPDGAPYSDMKVMKLAANSRYVYVYLEFNDPGFEYGRPFDMFIDHDGDPSTGCILTSIDNDTVGEIFTSYGIRWYIELALHDGDHYNDFHSWGGIYRFDGTDGTGAFSGGLGSIGAFEATMMCAEGGISEGVGRLEIQLNRTDFGMTGNKARFGVKIMDGANNWRALGILPQGTPSAGAFKPADMGTIYLPVYAE